MSAAKGRYHKPGKYLGIVDGVAVAHLLIANLILVLGVITPFFEWMILYYGEAELLVRTFVRSHPAIYFLYAYIDYPIYHFFKEILISKPKDLMYTYVLAEIVIVGCSFLYSLIVYLILKALKLNK